jgi:hypothetical protein
MRRLSSGSTLFSKFVVPGIFIALIPVWIIIVHRGPYGSGLLIIWLLACAIHVYWGIGVKEVRLDSERFLISNLRREISVPTTHLVKVSEVWWFRTPNMVLYFDPPTPLGRKVRVIVGWNFGKNSLGRLADEMREIVKKNSEVASAKLRALP